MVDPKSSFYDPVLYWSKRMCKEPKLELVGKEVLRLSTNELASVFQEAVFSFGGRNTKGDQSRCGPLRLNARQFVHFNWQFVSNDFEEELSSGELFKTERKRTLTESVKNNYKQINSTIEPIRNPNERLKGLQRHKITPCPRCNNVCWELFVVDETFEKDEIRCDMQRCKRTTALKEQEKFLGCTNCEHWDICEACYSK